MVGFYVVELEGIEPHGNCIDFTRLSELQLAIGNRIGNHFG